ncbi:MAG: (2Fe-2S)-binding protein [Myxococcota bacterium]|nr:(2Fe-2S)-binding protein [Myxococcota bacterium]
MPDRLILDFDLNGSPVSALAPANRSLLDLLREDLGHTGSKHGCDIGDCGACTVLLDGKPVLACITLAASAQGRQVRTIEGVGVPEPSVLQQCFHEHVASQCGFCTPGIIMVLEALFEADPDPSEPAMREALGANICRCTGYTKILSAAIDARERLNGRPPKPPVPTFAAEME